MTLATTLRQIDDAREFAHRAMRAALMEEVGVCDATSVLGWMIDTPTAKRLCDAPAAAHLNASTFFSRWQGAGAPSLVTVHRLIQRVRLRAVCDVPSLAFSAAVFECGFSAAQHAGRMIRQSTGLTPSAWVARTTPASVLGEWTDLLRDTAPALRAITLAAPRVNVPALLAARRAA